MDIRILRGRLKTSAASFAKTSAVSFAKNRVDDCLLPEHSPEIRQTYALSE
ncbi:hypothetical protein [Neisseria sicca]|uniref:hypothetical protein n=1 Tax=Neisseria sicca TaxID=490 RepID=UPI0015E07939|nr:hypothetical protein [Neisseria sicca]